MAITAEDRNLLVDFGEIPDPPEAPDVGIAIRVDSEKNDPGRPVFLSGSYWADGALLTQCGGELNYCISLTLARIDKLESTTRPLVMRTVVLEPPPLGEYDEYYRRGGQFRLDLRKFFELTDEPAIYAIEAKLGTYSSGLQHFRVGLP